jgi:hypothetical protein
MTPSKPQTQPVPMTRGAWLSLWEVLIDNGFAATLAGGVHPDMTPRENYSVTVHAISLGPDDLRSLATIGENHGVGLHLINGAPSYLERAQTRRIRP